MSEVKVNKISPRTNCGTVQLGDSGDTFTIPAGATITNNGTAAGFGSTGEVSWNTTKITADPGNAVSGVGYFTDTSGGAFNVTLPSSPSAGNVVAVADYANTWDTNNLTIARNGSNIEGDASDFVCNQEGATITFVYVDATKGWVCTNSGNSSQAFEALYVTATGGTITTCGDFKIHTFTGPGTFTVSCAGNPGGSTAVDYLVVAGGGGGGGTEGGAGGGSGAGAGGYRTTFPSPNCNAGSFPISAQAYPITVGGGGSPGTGVPGPSAGNNGGDGANSVFSTITANGGGGGRGGPCGSQNGAPGGSGGGASGGNPNGRAAGAGNTPPVSPPQGNDGGAHNAPSSTYTGAGGGGAGGAGGDVTPAKGVPGPGAPNSITGSGVTYSTGGEGGDYNGRTGGAGGAANTGDGGSAGSGPATPGLPGGGGGSGIVVIRYKYQ